MSLMVIRVGKKIKTEKTIEICHKGQIRACSKVLLSKNP